MLKLLLLPCPICVSSIQLGSWCVHPIAVLLLSRNVSSTPGIHLLRKDWTTGALLGQAL